MQFNNPSSTKMKTKNMATSESRNSIRRFSSAVGFTSRLALAHLLCTSTSASACPGAGRRLSRRQHRRGQNALLNLTTGTYNTAVGFVSLSSTAEASFNTAIGAGTLLANTGEENTATGAGALLSNTTSSANTAHGAFALFNNTIGFRNTAVGNRALFSNSIAGPNSPNNPSGFIGSYNTATGAGALENNTTPANRQRSCRAL